MNRFAAIGGLLVCLAATGCSKLTEPDAITIRKEPPPAPVEAKPTAADAQNAGAQAPNVRPGPPGANAAQAPGKG